MQSKPTNSIPLILHETPSTRQHGKRTGKTVLLIELATFLRRYWWNRLQRQATNEARYTTRGSNSRQ